MMGLLSMDFDREVECCLRDLFTKNRNNYYMVAALTGAHVKNVRKWMNGISRPGTKYANKIIALCRRDY